MSLDEVVESLLNVSCAPPGAEASPQDQACAGTVWSPRTKLIIEIGKPKICIRER